jgi:hypothetical protein
MNKLRMKVFVVSDHHHQLLLQACDRTNLLSRPTFLRPASLNFTIP